VNTARSGRGARLAAGFRDHFLTRAATCSVSHSGSTTQELQQWPGRGAIWIRARDVGPWHFSHIAVFGRMSAAGHIAAPSQCGSMSAAGKSRLRIVIATCSGWSAHSRAGRQGRCAGAVGRGAGRGAKRRRSAVGFVRGKDRPMSAFGESRHAGAERGVRIWTRSGPSCFVCGDGDDRQQCFEEAALVQGREP
jgi:hypothetical protein